MNEHLTTDSIYKRDKSSLSLSLSLSLSSSLFLSLVLIFFSLAITKREETSCDVARANTARPLLACKIHDSIPNSAVSTRTDRPPIETNGKNLFDRVCSAPTGGERKLRQKLGNRFGEENALTAFSIIYHSLDANSSILSRFRFSETAV